MASRRAPERRWRSRVRPGCRSAAGMTITDLSAISTRCGFPRSPAPPTGSGWSMKTRNPCKPWSARWCSRAMPSRSRRPRSRSTEGKSVTVTAQAGGAQKVYWILKRDGAGDRRRRGPVLATPSMPAAWPATRRCVLQFKAVYADEVKTKDIPVTIKEDDSRAGVHSESAGEVEWPGAPSRWCRRSAISTR